MTAKRALLFMLPVCAFLPLACAKESGGPAGAGSTSASVQASATTPTVASTPSAAPSGSASAVASANKPAGMHHGPAGMLFHTARTLDLKDAQKTTLDKLEADLRTDDGAEKTEMKAMHADMVAGIKAGKLDTAKLEAHQAAMEKAMAAMKDKSATALNGLHAALEPAQRKALVAAVRAKEGEHKEGEHKEGKGPGPNDQGKLADMGKRRLERMTKELGLDADQQKKVEGMAPKFDPKVMADMRAEWKKNQDALLSAFEQDTFDAKKLEAFTAPAKKNAMMENEMKFMSQLLTVLKPEQREKLAAKMEERAAHGPGQMGGPMGGPMGGHNGGHMGPMFGEPAGDEPAPGTAPAPAPVPVPAPKP